MSEENTRENIYQAWAPAGAVWSPWAKPVLFSVMRGFPLPPPLRAAAFDLSWVPAANGGIAIVLDLPQDEAVLAGLELAKKGFRPVPLYNALPGLAPLTQSFSGPVSIVNVQPIVDSLSRGAEELQKLTIPADAPPVFLLDSHRRGGLVRPSGVCFDNRSVCGETDFPSATFLKERGISVVILAQTQQDQPQPDLAHKLRSWHDARIEVQLKRLDVAGAAHPLALRPYSRFGAFFYWLGVAMRLVPNKLGGYGGIIGTSGGG